MKVNHVPTLSCRFALAAWITLAAASAGATLHAARPPQNPTPQLRLVAEKYLAGSFLGNQSVYADANFIYAAANTGEVFVMRRDKMKFSPIVRPAK